MQKITKAVIAVAGYGTRFLPATKNQPKEMLPIIDKPIVQYLVEEAVASGIKDIILVTRFGQSAMENHFDTNLELEIQLLKTAKKQPWKKCKGFTAWPIIFISAKAGICLMVMPHRFYASKILSTVMSRLFICLATIW